MTAETLTTELAAIYTGSGYSMPSVARYLHETATNGYSTSYDGSAGMAYYSGFKVFFSPYGYEIIAELI